MSFFCKSLERLHFLSYIFIYHIILHHFLWSITLHINTREMAKQSSFFFFSISYIKFPALYFTPLHLWLLKVSILSVFLTSLPAKTTEKQNDYPSKILALCVHHPLIYSFYLFISRHDRPVHPYRATSQ